MPRSTSRCRRSTCPFAMRNILAHQYADLDQEILQNTIDNRLPALNQLVSRMHAVAVARESATSDRHG